MRLLIAEDDSLHRSFLKTVTKGVLPDLTQLEEAADGARALELFSQDPFDSVILDLQMPHVTGVDAAKAIWSRSPKTRILFWSNYAEEAYIRGITKIVPIDSVYGYVLKSAPEDRLKLAIQGVFLSDQCVIDREVRGVQQRASDRVTSLTDMEYEALIDLSLGLTDKAIAARRNVSLRGAQSRLQQLYLKLGLDKGDIPRHAWGPSYNSRTRALSIALSRGLLNTNAIKQEEERLQSWMGRQTAV
ncbi:response regulator transcription factor [Jannaschia sp. M317]|uniref:response regulator transcription factor n=1 Tax=Jannaschia sp. M317 TaxID=2867011 RepID=UPI0021A32691|nr:response regulator transcription factor [Jannaschia sp. M317]UWQ17902.1 response regulator transcription factor [Jannaschia sp. M317]